MSLLASIALAAASGATLPACSWDRPGVNPYMGDVVAAVDRYKDIPAAVRARLKQRMQDRSYDEIVSIKRDGITGKARYGSEIRDMHFGAGSVCTTVTRTQWTQTMEERGLVYCEDGHCILVPTVCRNVSRIQRLSAPAAAPAATTNIASAAREDDLQTPLEMDPPSAGVIGGGAPTSFAAQAGGGGSGLDGGTVESTPGSILTGGFPAGSGGNAGPGFGSFPVPGLPPGTITTDPVDPTPPVVPPIDPPIVVPPIDPPIVVPPIDPPVLPPVPEPGTWALMLAGLASVALAARRRRG